MIDHKISNYPHLLHVNNHQNSFGYFNDFGVSHDLEKHLQFTQKSKRLKSEIVSKLKSDFLFDRTFITFLFLASGHEQLERFSALPFNNIICVDYQIDNYRCIKVADNKKIYTIPTDVITALSILKQVGVVVDVLCDNNSGENLGFGSGYSLSSQLVLSVGLPIFNPSKLIVIGSKQYQKNNGNYLIYKNYLKLGYNKRKELKINELANYRLDFDPTLLTLYPHSSSDLNYFILQDREPQTEKVFNYKGKSIHLIQGNIFDKMEDFEMTFLIFRSKYQYTHFKNNYPNVMDGRASYRLGNEVLDFNSDKDLAIAVQKLGFQSIAFIPQNKPSKNWIELLEELSKVKDLTDIYFYYITKNDFKQLYRLFEENQN